MQTQFEFDAEGVFDQPIKPLRIRKRKQPRKKFEQWIEMTQGATLEARAIKQTMQAPKLLKHTMPSVMPKNISRAKQSLADRSERLTWQAPQVPPDAFGVAAAKAKSKHTQSKFRVLVGYEWRKVFSKQCLCRVMKTIDYAQKHFGEISAYEARNVGGHPIAEFPPLAAVRQARVLRKLRK